MLAACRLFFDCPLQLPLARAGSIKAYAVTNDVRLPLAPDIPTFGEMGFPTLSYSEWFGLFAPKGTPRDIVGKINAAVVEALAYPAVRSAILGWRFSRASGRRPRHLPRS
jgi:tripartite-type tricarboxylate transporter receptor subunit TctC